MQLDRTNNPSWIQTDLERGKWIPYNRYFMDHPEMLMGKMESSRNMYGSEDGTACIAPEGFDLYEHLSDAVEAYSLLSDICTAGFGRSAKAVGGCPSADGPAFYL